MHVTDRKNERIQIMKMTFNIFTLAVIFLILTTKLTRGQGIIIAQHSGFNNPISEGFTGLIRVL